MCVKPKRKRLRQAQANYPPVRHAKLETVAGTGGRSVEHAERKRVGCRVAVLPNASSTVRQESKSLSYIVD